MYKKNMTMLQDRFPHVAALIESDYHDADIETIAAKNGQSNLYFSFRSEDL